MYNTETFIEKAKEKHGDFYDYSHVDYQGSRKKVEIICPKHGPFLQRADGHLEGKGCPICGHEKTGLATRKNTKNKSIIIDPPKISIIENPELCTNSTIVGTIYVFINSNNNKIYVGKTIESFTVRWSGHKRGYNNLDYYFYKAIRKYGWDKFNKYVIYQTEKLKNTKENKKYLNDIISEKEKYYIKLYKSNDHNFGYNSTEGGEGTPCRIVTENEISKRKNIGKVVLQYDLNNNFIREWPCMKLIKKELGYNLERIRECCNNKRTSWKSYIWKYKEVPELVKNTKSKSKSKRLLQYNTNGEFIKEWESASQVQTQIGLDNHVLRACCRGDYNTCGGYIWLYKESENFPLKLDKQILIDRKLYSPYIAQYDINANLVALWKNTTEIEQKLKYSRVSIRSCIRKDIKTAYGYIWKELERDFVSKEEKERYLIN